MRMIPEWVPLCLALVAAVIGYVGMIRPQQHALQDANLTLAGRRAAVEQLTGAIRTAAHVPDVPQPASQQMVNRRWPDLVHAALALGYRFDLANFADGPQLTARPADAPSNQGAASAPPAARSMEITINLFGPYLQLDEAARTMQRVLPLWVWRAVRVTTAEAVQGAHITLVGLIPVEGGVVPPQGAAVVTTAPRLGQVFPTPPAAFRPAQGGR